MTESFLFEKGYGQYYCILVGIVPDATVYAFKKTFRIQNT